MMTLTVLTAYNTTSTQEATEKEIISIISLQVYQNQGKNRSSQLYFELIGNSKMLESLRIS